MVDTERLIEQFSPDTKELTLEYCFGALFGQEHPSVPVQRIVELCGDLR